MDQTRIDCCTFDCQNPANMLTGFEDHAHRSVGYVLHIFLT